MTPTTAATAADPYANLGLSTIGATPASAQTATAERFLKMLVAQMENQDPLNPLDNAQVTSQMAQINTVSGLEQVNTSVKSLNTQLLQLQALQGASLVGRDVSVEGNRLAVADGIGRGGFDLPDKADQVLVEVLTPGGTVLDAMRLGSQGAGRHGFEWNAGAHTDAEGLMFRVTAVKGNEVLAGIPVMLDRVRSVATGGDTLTLNLQRSGDVPAGSVLGFN